jgi:hypothetical protein
VCGKSFGEMPVVPVGRGVVRGLWAEHREVVDDQDVRVRRPFPQRGEDREQAVFDRVQRRIGGGFVGEFSDRW